MARSWVIAGENGDHRVDKVPSRLLFLAASVGRAKPPPTREKGNGHAVRALDVSFLLVNGAREARTAGGVDAANSSRLVYRVTLSPGFFDYFDAFLLPQHPRRRPARRPETLRRRPHTIVLVYSTVHYPLSSLPTPLEMLPVSPRGRPSWSCAKTTPRRPTRRQA